MSKDPMTDAEAWADLGENLKGAGFVKYGLCSCLQEMAVYGATSFGQTDRMKEQLYTYRERLGASCGRYFWPEGQLAPRVKACAKLARLVAKERA